jgi:toxin-antitoxin system PIN domain toxin
MELLDANVLIGAFRTDDPDHATLRRWLEEALNQGLLVTFPPLVEVAFLRITTHPRIFATPSPREEAMGFLRALVGSGQFRESPWTQRTRARWWQWCRDLDLRGNDVNDAFLAAIAAEAHCRLISRDGGFSRFPGLDWWNPTGPEVQAPRR